MAHPMSHVPDALIISLYYIKKIKTKKIVLFVWSVCECVCMWVGERSTLIEVKARQGKATLFI